MSNTINCPSSSSSSSSSASQQFCLKWNNHGVNLVRTLTEMVGEGNFVDVTLACEGSSIKAHKMVLSACSNYFKELFLANPCQHPIVILKDMKIDDLRGIINFMYKGEVNVSQNQLGALLKTAEILKVKGLTEVNDEDEQRDEMKFNSSNSNNSNNNNANGATNSGTGAVNANSISGNCKNNAATNDSQLMPSLSSSAVAAVANMSSSNSTLNVVATRKKKRRRAKKSSNGANSTSADDTSGSDLMNSSDNEETVDIHSIKRAKESLHHNQQQQQLQQQQQQAQQVQSNIPDSVQQNNRRRNQQMPQQSQVQTQLCLTQGESLDNSNDGNLYDSSEPWMQRQTNSISGQGNTDADEESDDMIDVKPIISFNEGSVTSMSNSLALALPNEIGNSLDVSVMSPGTQNTPTGKICVCHLCHLTFTAYSSLRRHMHRHYADRERYECDICMKSYSRKDYLKEHKKLKHAVG